MGAGSDGDGEGATAGVGLAGARSDRWRARAAVLSCSNSSVADRGPKRSERALTASTARIESSP